MPPRAGRTDTGLVHASGWPLPRRLPRAARALRDPRDGAHTGAVRAGHRDAGRSARRGCRGAVRRHHAAARRNGGAVPDRARVGPIIDRPVRSTRDIARLRVIDADDATPYLFETIRALRR